ncbi:hypothetical protein LZQ00_09370 [Sphingobacterium sp. SRCM116780]|uniref:hypothetical protein n=1 Tax=Sphingobacterium sp. SRCM116780 TaxID=2907623 RepID=UPI001F32BB1F|nr:hypothetical protein [Sphingobacterium sp. SRCM116780]UIR54481.1 hypothetical protein LZQ00_09370 [Sphingobacterium sp. SRCM116780]
MKKNTIAILMLSVITIFYSCKDKKKEQENQTATVPQTKDSTTDINSGAEPKTSGAEPKTYQLTALPDSVSLGKNKEAFIRIKELKAIELSNPDGTSAGIELSYKIELTNKNAIGGTAVGIPTTDFRLELDNGNKIAPNSIFVNAEPESSKLSDFDKFTIPAGAKPVALHLYYDQTKASVKLEMK